MPRRELKGGVSSEGNVLNKDIELRRRITLVLPGIGVFNTTVFNNAAYGLKIRRDKTKKAEKNVNDVLKFVGLIHKKITMPLRFQAAKHRGSALQGQWP